MPTTGPAFTTRKPRFNHVAMSLTPEMLDEEHRKLRDLAPPARSVDDGDRRPLAHPLLITPTFAGFLLLLDVASPMTSLSAAAIAASRSWVACW